MANSFQLPINIPYPFFVAKISIITLFGLSDYNKKMYR